MSTPPPARPDAPVPTPRDPGRTRPGSSRYAPPKDERAWKRKRNIAIGIVLGLVVVGAALLPSSPESESAAQSPSPEGVVPPPPSPSSPEELDPEPDPRVPKVTGLQLSNARDRLSSRGAWDIVVKRREVSKGRTGDVLQQQPRSGRRLGEQNRLVLFVARVPLPQPPTLEPAPGTNSSCDYDPCLPPASDYDCAGGSGDGPEYTGRVTVTGSDPYGLDADGDGVGCE
jgi:hypothetical protein